MLGIDLLWLGTTLCLTAEQLFISLPLILNMARQSTQLNKGWTFRQHQGPSPEWLPVEHVPTQVHKDLLANKKYGPG